MRVLTKDQVESYHKNGFCHPIDVFSETEADKLRQSLEQAELGYPDALNSTNRNNAHLAFCFLDEIAHNEIILDAVEDLIGPNILLSGSVLFIKDARSSSFVSWHQDATYMGFSSNDFVTPWIALTDSNIESGCMRMLLGSHLGPILKHEDTFGEDNILTRGQRIMALEKERVVNIELRPGQMSLHHPKVIHSSMPNQSDSRRIGLALQSYMSPHTRQTIGKNYALIVRGRDTEGHALLLQRPATDMEQQSVAQREEANQNLSSILYHGSSKVRSY